MVVPAQRHEVVVTRRPAVGVGVLVVPFEPEALVATVVRADHVAVGEHGAYLERGAELRGAPSAEVADLGHVGAVDEHTLEEGVVEIPASHLDGYRPGTLDHAVIAAPDLVAQKGITRDVDDDIGPPVIGASLCAGREGHERVGEVAVVALSSSFAACGAELMVGLALETLDHGCAQIGRESEAAPHHPVVVAPVAQRARRVLAAVPAEPIVGGRESQVASSVAQPTHALPTCERKQLRLGARIRGCPGSHRLGLLH